MATDQVERRCEVCGKSLVDDKGGIHRYDPNTGQSTFFCGEHRPNPPSPERLTDRALQEREAGLATLKVEVEFMKGLIADPERPVSTVDRANIQHELMRLFDRTLWLTNEVLALKGEEDLRLPPRHEW